MTTPLNLQQLTIITGGFVTGAKTNFDSCYIVNYDRHIDALGKVAEIALETAQDMPETRITLRAAAVFGAIVEIAPDLHSDADPETDYVWETLDRFEDSLRGLHHALK